MNWQNRLFWGVFATPAQVIFEAATQGLRLTRISLPYMLETLFTGHRSKAKVFGFFAHIANSLLFAIVYIVAFHYLGEPTW